jgi:hypothetical protein
MNVVPLSLNSDFAAQQATAEMPLTRSVFPRDALAVIYKPAPSPMSSGLAHTGDWKLRFERRSPPYIEPLMGWTGSGDTLTQVELCFPSAESAVAYARRQGIQFRVEGLSEQEAKPRLVSNNAEAGGRAASKQRRRRLEWVERTLGPEVLRHGYGPGLDPAASYADPQDVLGDRNLSQERKRDVLRRWALDAYRIEIEHSRSNSLSEPSRLQEAIDALLDLEEPHITPASFQHIDRKAG